MGRFTASVFRQLDKSDPLAGFREKFYIPDRHIYFKSNVLGVLPKDTGDHVKEVVLQEWGQGLADNSILKHWQKKSQRVSNNISRIVGADSDKIFLCDSIVFTFLKLASAALNLNAGKTRVVLDSEISQAYMNALHGLLSIQRGLTLDIVPHEQIIDCIDKNTAFIALPHVCPKNGNMLDLDVVTDFAHEKGVLTIWDLSHSAGVVPLELQRNDVDFALGCGHTYLSGGPGAPSFLYVSDKYISLINQLCIDFFQNNKQRLPNISDKQMIQYSDNGAWFENSVISTAMLEVGVDIVSTANKWLVRKKSKQLGDLFVELIAELCPAVKVISEKNNELRGSQVSVLHNESEAIIQALNTADIKGDFIASNIMRFGFSPLTNQYLDIWNAVIAIKKIIESGNYTYNAIDSDLNKSKT